MVICVCYIYISTHFYRFPKDATLQKEWLHKIRRVSFKPSNFTRICSHHFEPECIVKGGKNKYLKAGSIPTIFPSFPKHLQKRAYKRKPPKERTSEQAAEPSPLLVCKEHNYGFSSQKDLKKRNDILVKRNVILLKKLKLAKMSRKKYANKCMSLKEVVQNLNEKILVRESVQDILQNTSSKVPVHLFQRLVNSKTKKGDRTYSKELKSFSITLQFYSSRSTILELLILKN